MSRTPADRGYLIKNLTIQSTKEIISRTGHDRILTVSKGAVKDFIYQFFETEQGQSVLGIISPDAVNFVVNKSFNPQSDHTKKQLQLASFFEEVKEVLPSILIIDSGCKYAPSGISPLARTTYVEDKLESVFHIQREIPMTIVIASNDEETTSQLTVLIEFLFGELRNFMDGDQLVSNNAQDEWTVTLPRVLDSENITPAESQAMQGDTKDRIWRSSISFPNPIIFEDYVKIEESKPQIEVHDAPRDYTPVIVFPSELKINEPQTVTIREWNPTAQRISISDARVASLDPNTKVITARKYGTFDVRILSTRTNNEEGGVSNGLPPEILASQTVTVIP